MHNLTTKITSHAESKANQKRWVFKAVLQMDSEAASLMGKSSEFQSLGVATVSSEFTPHPRHIQEKLVCGPEWMGKMM